MVVPKRDPAAADLEVSLRTPGGWGHGQGKLAVLHMGPHSVLGSRVADLVGMEEAEIPWLNALYRLKLWVTLPGYPPPPPACTGSLHLQIGGRG